MSYWVPNSPNKSHSSQSRELPEKKKKIRVFDKTAEKHYANVKVMRRGGGRGTGINQTLNQISRRIIAKLLLACSTQFCSRYGQE